MKGESIGAGKQIADPLTLGMLERLEGIVKIRHQMKFSVRSGRARVARAGLARAWGELKV